MDDLKFLASAREKSASAGGCAIAVIALLLLGLAALLPFLTIWSLNQLFQLHIEYTFLNWCATLWLTMLVFRPAYTKSNGS